MAGSTTWLPLTRPQPNSWLLTNGEIVTEPVLEQSSSGRRVRIAGTNLAMYSKEVDQLIYKGVEALAASKNAQVWMCLDEGMRRSGEASVLGFEPRRGTVAQLHLLGDQGTRGRGKTAVWWRFRHPSLPIEAVLAVHLKGTYAAYRGDDSSQILSVSLVMQSTNPAHAASVAVIASGRPDLYEFAAYGGDAPRLALSQLVRDNPPNWHDDVVPQQSTLSSARKAIKALLGAVNAIDSYDEIDVPDLREPDKPSWLRLQLHDTNLTGDFLQSLHDYLDGSGVVTQAREHYQAMRGLLSSAGLVLAGASEDAFAQALAGGVVTVSVLSGAADEGHTQDHNHSVSLHLATGSLVVDCTAAAATNNEVAHAWDEAMARASITGEEDDLLAYARAWRERRGAERVQNIIRERRE